MDFRVVLAVVFARLFGPCQEVRPACMRRYLHIRISSFIIIHMECITSLAKLAQCTAVVQYYHKVPHLFLWSNFVVLA